MTVITIRGQLGSGAPEIGQLIAQQLHIDYVDREIIAEVASRLKSPKEGIEKKEMPPGTLWDKIADALSHTYTPTAGRLVYLPVWEIPPDDSRYLEGLKSVIKELAAGQSIVIRGRGSQFILKGFPGAVHILVVAPYDLRLRRVIESMKTDEKSAKNLIEHFDGSRREFVKRYFQAELDNPLHYDLVINTEHLTYEAATDIIVGVVKLIIK